MDVFGDDIGEARLGAVLGDITQIASIRHMRFENGPEAGSRLIQIRNASGLCVELLPDRCLDIGQVWLNGIPFSWMGPGGLPPGYAGHGMDTALGGLMATCGFDHIRQPETVEGTHYPLHGSMALQSARVLSAAGEVGQFVVRAEVRQTTLTGAAYKLSRRITVPFVENKISVEDHVSAIPATPIFALYHINLGYPLIRPETIMRVGGENKSDRLADAPQIQIEPSPKSDYAIRVESARKAPHQAIDIAVNGNELPYLQTFRRAEPGVNLFCIEPTTHDRKPHAELLKLSEAQASEWSRFALRFSFEAPNVDAGW